MCKIRANTFDNTQYYNRLAELVVAMFDWENLPDMGSPSFVEIARFPEVKVVNKNGQKETN